MLLPALNKAREKGKSIACINNLKQIGLSMQLYGDDYDEWMAPFKNASAKYWPTRLVPTYLPGKYSGSDISSCPTLVCPSSTADLPSSGNARSVSYSMGQRYGHIPHSAGDSTYSRRKFNRFYKPSVSIYLADGKVAAGSSWAMMRLYWDGGNSDWDWGWGNTVTYPNPYARHGGMVNALFVDGHARSIKKYNEIPYAAWMGFSEYYKF
jgi:prepilin-type processing-associated H-X9-DG protein